MTLMAGLAIAILIAAVAAITGLKPKDSRPVARTQLMGVARLVLLLAAVALAYFVFAAPRP